MKKIPFEVTYEIVGYTLDNKILHSSIYPKAIDEFVGGGLVLKLVYSYIHYPIYILHRSQSWKLRLGSERV